MPPTDPPDPAAGDLYTAGAAIIVAAGFAIAGAATALVAGIGMTAPGALSGTAAGITYLVATLPRRAGASARRHAMRIAGLLVVDVAACVLLVTFAGRFFDLSWDGQSYHAEAVASLAKGWNPLRDAYAGPWYLAQPINLYPKGAWLLGALLANVGGSIEHAKAITPILALGCFLVVAAEGIASRVHRGVALALSLLVVLNPVVIQQSLSLYVDAQVALCVTLLIVLSLRMVRSPDASTLVPLAATGVLLINAKLSGAFYFLVFTTAFALWMAWRHRATATRYLAAILVTLVLALPAAINPYVTNTIAQAWPITFKAANVRGNTPPDLRDLPAPTKLVVSLASRTEAAITTSRLKAPFAVDAAELSSLPFPDPRTGGFGPWFSGALLLTACLGCALAVQRSRAARVEVGSGLGFAVVAIVASLLVFPDAWWARYAPQAWLIPIAGVVAGLALTTRTRATSMLAVLVAAALSANVALVAIHYFSYQLRHSREMARNLDSLRQLGVPIEATLRHEAVNAVRFAERGIAFSLTDKPGCPRPFQLSKVSVTLLCLPSGANLDPPANRTDVR